MAHVVLVGALASGALVNALAIFILVVLAGDALVRSLQSQRTRIVIRVKLHGAHLMFEIQVTDVSVAAVQALVVAELAVGVLVRVLVGWARLDADVVVGEVLAGEAVSWSLKHADARDANSNCELLHSAICCKNIAASKGKNQRYYSAHSFIYIGKLTLRTLHVKLYGVHVLLICILFYLADFFQKDYGKLMY